VGDRVQAPDLGKAMLQQYDVACRHEWVNRQMNIQLLMVELTKTRMAASCERVCALLSKTCHC
jgi:hypothetical protein